MSPHVNIPVTVTNQWTRNDVNVPMGQSDDTITADLTMIDTLTYNATLTFYPLDNTDDSGNYTCNVHVRPTMTNSYIRSTSENNSALITVLGKVMYGCVNLTLHSL